jgi:hypothetical protein
MEDCTTDINPGIKERCCDYYKDRSSEFDICPVIIHGSEHLHTDCRACKYNEFDFYKTLEVIRRKMSINSPVWIGTKPIVHEEYLKFKNLNDCFYQKQIHRKKFRDGNSNSQTSKS